MNYSKEVLSAAHHHSSHHKSEILDSELCGCFYCLETYSPSQITDWTDRGTVKGPTAICPACGIDAVIGSSSGYPVGDPDFLLEMRDCWF